MLEQASAAVNREGWQKVRFDQMATNVRDQVIPAESGIDKYIGLEHLDSMSLKIKRWDEGRELKGSKLKIKAGDIVIGKRNWYLRRVAIADFDTLCSAHSMVVRPKEDTILRGFLPHFLLSDTFFETACAISVGSLSKTINWRDIAKQEFVIPPIEKQKEIAELMWEAENSIEDVDDLIETTLIAKKSIAVKSYNLKEEHKTRLGDFAYIRRGASPRPIGDAKYFSDDGPGWIRIRDVTSSTRFLRKTEQYLSDLGAEKSVRVGPGDVIMSICATIGRPIIVDMDACIHDGFVLFKNISEDVDPMYLYYFLWLKTKRFESLAQPGTQKNLNTEIVKKTAFFVPTLEKQKQIVNVLVNYDNKIDSLRTHREKLVALKASLIETLLDGSVTDN